MQLVFQNFFLMYCGVATNASGTTWELFSASGAQQGDPTYSLLFSLVTSCIIECLLQFDCDRQPALSSANTAFRPSACQLNTSSGSLGICSTALHAPAAYKASVPHASHQPPLSGVQCLSLTVSPSNGHFHKR